MTEAPCPHCGTAHEVSRVFEAGGCPTCETPLSELHAQALGGDE